MPIKKALLAALALSNATPILHGRTRSTVRYDPPASLQHNYSPHLSLSREPVGQPVTPRKSAPRSPAKKSAPKSARSKSSSHKSGPSLRRLSRGPTAGRPERSRKSTQKGSTSVFRNPEIFEMYGNGGVYEGELKDGKPHGRGTMRYANGNVCDGAWKRGRMIAELKATSQDCHIFDYQDANDDQRRRH